MLNETPPLLLFVHIPKTAGTTITTILNLNEPGNRSLALANVFKGGGGFDPDVVDRLRDGDGPNLKGVRIARGHVPVGLREHLAGYTTGGREIRPFTFLRDPVERSLSHYFRIRDRYSGTKARHALAPLPADPTLEDLLAGGYMHDNLQTRMLSGEPAPFGEVTDAMLERAKRNIREELVFVGLTERLDESLVLARWRLGLGTVLYRADGERHSRVNPARPRGSGVSAELTAAAKAYNAHDVELYRTAKELFERAPELAELEFAVDVAALQTAKFYAGTEAEPPPPDAFTGSDEEWRMLLEAKVTVLRQERELAKIRAERILKSPRQAARLLRAARRAGEDEEGSAEAPFESGNGAPKPKQKRRKRQNLPAD